MYSNELKRTKEENEQLREENKKLKSRRESYNEFLKETLSQGDSAEYVCLEEDKLESYQLRYEYVQQRITLIKEELNELRSYLFKEKAHIKAISHARARADRDEILQEQHCQKWKHWKNAIHKQSEQYYLQLMTYYEMDLIADRQAWTKQDKPFSK